MYQPTHFEEKRVEVLHGLIRAHPLATLVTFGSSGLEANHIPIEIDPAPAPFGTLRGHVARGNPVWREFKPDVEALLVFQGAQSYISPSWYETKKQTGKVVPTFNYAVVHAYGPLRVVEDREWLRALVTKLTSRHEADNADPWKVTDAPPDYVNQMLGAIVGIEIAVTRLLGKWKVSQNRPPVDRHGVVNGLGAIEGDNAAAMAELVKAIADS